MHKRFDESVPHDVPSPRTGNEKLLEPLLCRICGEPVSVSNAKAEAEGKGIHEDCYALTVKFEQAKRDGPTPNDGDAKSRPWKVIAAEVTKEQDPEKMTELVRELNQALDQQHIDGTPKAKLKAEGKPEHDVG